MSASPVSRQKRPSAASAVHQAAFVFLSESSRNTVWNSRPLASSGVKHKAPAKDGGRFCFASSGTITRCLYPELGHGVTAITQDHVSDRLKVAGA